MALPTLPLAGSTLCVLVLYFLAPGRAWELEPQDLSDSDFEHRTQASTGQTAGRWCILFAPADPDPEYAHLDDVMSALASEEDQRTIFAKVDTSRNLKTVARFGLQYQAPVVLLFADRQMFLFPGELRATGGGSEAGGGGEAEGSREEESGRQENAALVQTLQQFVDGAYRELHGFRVPGPKEKARWPPSS